MPRRSIKMPAPGDGDEIARRLANFHAQEASGARPRTQFRPNYRGVNGGGAAQPVRHEQQSRQEASGSNDAALGKARTYLSRAMAAANSGDLAKVQAQLSALSDALDGVE